MKELSGEWVGYYEYGLGYYLPYFGQRVKYQIEVTFEDDLISFVKTYPVKSTIQEDHTIQNFKGEQFVNHTGFLDKDKMVMYGLWTIEIHTIEKDEFYEPNQCEGIWLLEKQ